MKKTYILFLACLFCFIVKAQYSIQPVLPAAGFIQKTQLWNVTAFNNALNPISCRLDMTLKDRETGMDVMAATSGIFTLAKGAMQLNATNISPIQYNYLFASANTANGFLPVGNYLVCYRLISAADKGIYAEECLPLDIEPLSPPMLILPADSSISATKPEQFTWVPPTPANMFTRLQYDVLITEILPGQKPPEAIQLNVPFYFATSQPYTVLNNTATMPVYEKNKWYAWQVTARDAKNYAAKSEVWVFSVNDSIKPVIPQSISYLILGGNSAFSGIHVITGNVLNIKYYSFDKDRNAVVDILSKDKKLKSFQQNISYGDNYLSFKLNSSFKENEIYKVQITDEKGNKHIGQFIITKN